MRLGEACSHRIKSSIRRMGSQDLKSKRHKKKTLNNFTIINNNSSRTVARSLLLPPVTNYGRLKLQPLQKRRRSRILLLIFHGCVPSYALLLLLLLLLGFSIQPFRLLPLIVHDFHNILLIFYGRQPQRICI